ncbi:VOC family protein [Alkalicoccobacillus porphyridii]|uniref:Glyoxalase/bleomycin resistance/extradiol dioxygenase family protein n=1 Tax=Alkalicoccobacillus porphyridii TaxID=2597270 RepID=A0A554A2G7_9BACI|nr:VOC family protein [Alkalicoccobacillus porphyridii]TSB47878.1 glyoxalase/bleomycin resistance/extradiol dioxygenase family protein [Alkalicoccobacillus porphyridii]
MSVHAKQIFVNLPIKSLKQSKQFFSELGFTFNEHFENENTTCMIVNESIYVMLLEEDRFQSFTNKEIPNLATSAGSILAFSLGSRAEVDEVVNRALSAGASKYNDPQDHGFMYGWSFADLDGHLWEFFYMDEEAAAQAAQQQQ